ncbi:phage integrase SAM-like domain-containing protein [Pedobacter cryoconitis]|uniref:phage integrase SAM-like domain-containing protein n=1 Tax=Pedobacter cryoconitis TaxID=188932 RepID=UPI0016161523
MELEYRADDKRSTANVIRMVINNLIDYQKSEIIYTRDITVDFLKGFERYLKKLYEQIRTKGPNVNQLTRMPGLKESSIATQFFLFKLIFNS